MPKDQLRPGDLQDLRVASRAARAGLLEQQRLALRPLVSPHGIYHGKLWQLEETHGKGCWELRKLCDLLGAKACVAARGKATGTNQGLAKPQANQELVERSEAPSCLLLLSHEIFFKEKLKESLASELTATPTRPWQELAAFRRLPTTSETRSSRSTKLLRDTPTGTGAEAPSACGPQEPDCIRAHLCAFPRALCSGWSSLNSSLKSSCSFSREVERTGPEQAEPCL